MYKHVFVMFLLHKLIKLRKNVYSTNYLVNYLFILQFPLNYANKLCATHKTYTFTIEIIIIFFYFIYIYTLQ